MSPATVTLPHTALSLTSHPTLPRLAVGLVTGGIVLADVPDFQSPSSPEALVLNGEITFPFSASCRALSVLPDTNNVLASTPEAQVLLFDVARKLPVHTYLLPKEDCDNSASVVMPVDANVVLAGDDIGGIHVLDLRCRSSSSPSASVLEQGDYISAILPVSAFGTDAWLVSSGDGTLCAYELRTPPRARLRLQYATDAFDDDLLSLAVLSANGLAVAGTLSGAINLYNLRFLDKQCEKEAAAHVDRFYGHPECVDAVLKYGEEGVVVTASSDGIVRVVDVVNKTFLGVLEYDATEAEAELDGKPTRKRKKRKKEAWPIESMVSIAGLAKPAFALLGHDNFIRLCDGAALEDDDTPDGESGKGEQANGVGNAVEERRSVGEERKPPHSKKKRKTFESAKPSLSNDFFDAL